MVSLKMLLSNLEGRRAARLELMSGRRPRLVYEGDARGDRADVKNLADEALTDDEVMSLCEAAGGGRKLETIDAGPVTWTYTAGAGAFRVTAELRGREIAASIAVADPGGVPPRRNSQSMRAARRSQPSIKPPRSDRSATRRPSIPAERAAARGVDPSHRGGDRPNEGRHHDERRAHEDRRHDGERRHEPRPHEESRHEPSARHGEVGAPHERPLRRQEHRLEPITPRALDRPHAIDARPPPTAAIEARAHESRPERRPTPRPAAPQPVPVVAAGPLLADLRWPTEQASAKGIAALLAEGRRLGASDLHLVPKRPALFRVAGALAPTRETFPAAETERAILSLVPAALRPAFASRGGADFAIDVPQLGRFRINVTLTLRGLKASLRFTPREVPSLATLGLPPHLSEATHHHQGLVVVTGPTGHGKTSTLAALVDQINQATTHHVITVEDPVEIVHPRKSALISQREVGAHTESFARALKGALRQDPDVIVVGELRDTETVRMALMASETGHLVLGTMNTPSAAATIEALIDLFPPGDQPQVRATLAGGLKYIVSQRLVRRADGTGRVVALETLPGSLPLWNLIRDQKTFQLPSLMQRGKGLGVVRLNDSLAELVRSGVVDAAEALAVSDTPDELDATLKGDTHKREEAPAREDIVGGLLGRAGAFFSRKGGD